MLILLALGLLNHCDANPNTNLLENNILKYPIFEEMLNYQTSHIHQRSRRQVGGTARSDVVDIDDTESFHGPDVTLPEISFRDMAGFVEEARRTVEERFDVLEKEIYRSSARQEPGSPEWFMAASTKTKEYNLEILNTMSFSPRI